MQLIKDIKKFGFCVGDRKILKESDQKYLLNLIDNHYYRDINKHDNSSNAPVIEDLVGTNEKFDSILNDILTHPIIKNVILSILGEGYKIWEISARYSLPGDTGLGIHQDAYGQMNLAIRLNDLDDCNGVTSFLPKSHLISRFAHKISWARPEIANRFSKALHFGNSDFAVFLNKTWHGRTKNTGTKIKKIILIGMFPAGAKFQSKISSNRIDKISSQYKELKKRIDYRIETKELDSNYYLILSKSNKDSNPFSLEIEDNNKYLFKSIPILSLIFLLEIIFKPIQLIVRILKKLNIYNPS